MPATAQFIKPTHQLPLDEPHRVLPGLHVVLKSDYCRASVSHYTGECGPVISGCFTDPSRHSFARQASHGAAPQTAVAGIIRLAPSKRRDVDNIKCRGDGERGLNGCIDEVLITDQLGVQPVFPPVPRQWDWVPIVNVQELVDCTRD